MSSEQGKKSAKVLRIGLINGGKLVEERRLKKRQTVSVGTDAKATFSVQSPLVPKTMDVFEIVDGKYQLRFNDEMGGGVQTEAGKSSVKSFKKLKKDAKTKKKGDHWVYPLEDHFRGKVIFGDPDSSDRVQLLFQFVDPPLAPGRAELPADMRMSFAAEIDIQFSSILIVTALCFVSVVAYASKQPYVEATTVEQLSERYQKLIMPDREPEPPQAPTVENPEEKGDAEKAKEKPKKKVAKKTKKKSKSKSKGKKVSAEDAARARKAAVSKKVAGKGLLGVIGTKGKGANAGALADVFADGSGVQSDLGNAFSGIQGVDVAEDGGAVGTRGGGSGEAADIGELQTEGGGSVSTGKKTETKVSGRVGTQAPEVEGELDTNKVQRAMRKYVSGIKNCYERALKRNPKLAGKITIAFDILESGKVAEFDFPVDTVDSAEVRKCIKSRSRSWRFPRPDGGSVYVQFPLVFEPSG